MTETINGLAAGWWSWIAPLSLQVAVLAAFVWLIDTVLRKRGWVQVRYALWLVVFARLVIPPGFSLPTSVSAGLIDMGRAAAPAAPQLTARAATADQFMDDGHVPAYEAPAAHGARIEPMPAPAAITPASPPRLTLSGKAYAMLAWSVVGLVLVGWLIMKATALRRLVRDGATAPGELPRVVERCAEKLRLREAPRVVLTGEVSSAAVFGVFRPVILLPEAVIGESTPLEMEHTLLHELAHIKRRDLAVNAAATLLHIAFWFNPLVWLAGRRLRELRELCCDATVAGLLGEATPEYRATLMGAAQRLMNERARLGLGLLGLFENTSRLGRRLEHLAGPLWKYRRLRAAAALAVVAAALLFVVPMARTTSDASSAASADADDEDTSAWLHTLPSGATVELVAVTCHPNERRPWWRPDGSPLPEPLYDRHGATMSPQTPTTQLREFAVRITLPAAAGPDWIGHTFLSPGYNWAGGGAPYSKEQQLRDLRVYAVSLPIDKKTFDFTIGVADGPWQTRSSARSGGTALGGNEGGFTFSPAVQAAEELVITVSDDIRDKVQRRVIAIDTAGNTHEPVRSEGLGAGAIYQTTATFRDIMVSEIAEFQLRTRGFERVEFRNVALNPSQSAAAAVSPAASGGGPGAPSRVETAAAAFRAGLEGGIEVEIVGVSEYPSDGTNWWAPDGAPLADAPYVHRPKEHSPSKTHLEREIAVRVSAANTETLGFAARHVNDSLTYSTQAIDRSENVPDGASHRRVPGLYEVRVVTLAAEETTHLKVGVAAGPWQTRHACELGKLGTYVSSAGDVAFTTVEQKGSDLYVTVDESCEPLLQKRIIATGPGGQVLLAGVENTIWLGGSRRTVQVWFHNTAPDQVRQLQFQTRPYQWVAFEDIPVHPRQPSAPDAPSVSSAPELSAGNAPAAVQRPVYAESAPPGTAYASGVVLDRDGKPAAGVEVTAYSRAGDEKSDPVRAETGQDGRFRLDLPVNPEYGDNRWLLAARDGTNIALGTAHWWRGGPAFDPVEMSLVPADGSVRGRLVDERGRAVRGADAVLWMARLTDTRGRYIYFPGYPDLQAAYAARSDRTGKFVIEGLPRGCAAVVSLWGKGRAMFHEKFTADGTEKTVVMPREAKISGKVVARQSGLRLGDLNILLRTLDSDNSFESISDTRQAETDRSGGFSFNALPACDSIVMAGHATLPPPWTCVPSQPVKLEAGRTARVTIEIIKGTKVRGRIVDKATGKGLPDGWVMATPATGLTVNIPTDFGETDEEGFFTLYLAPGRHNLSAMATMTHEIWPVSQDREITVTSGGDMELADFQLEMTPRPELPKPMPSAGEAEAEPEGQSGTSPTTVETAGQSGEWTRRLTALNDQGWREALALGYELAELPGDRGCRVLSGNWSRMANFEARRQILKAFAFTKHPYVLEVLHLGAADGDIRVQNWAFSYLENYALRSFAEDYAAYGAWREEFSAKPLEEVLEANVRFYVERLATARGVERNDLARFLEHLTHPGNRTDYPSKRRYAVEAGILGVFKTWLRDEEPDMELIDWACRSLKVFNPGREYLMEVVLPLADPARPAEIRAKAIGTLAAPGDAWAYDFLSGLLDGALADRQEMSAVGPALAGAFGAIDDPRATERLVDLLTAAAKADKAGGSAARSAVWAAAMALGRRGDPAAIPAMIAVIDADNTYDTVYGVGYFGLGELTGVSYDESHDGAWWLEWWEKNRARFGQEVSSVDPKKLAGGDMELPDFRLEMTPRPDLSGRLTPSAAENRPAIPSQTKDTSRLRAEANAQTSPIEVASTAGESRSSSTAAQAQAGTRQVTGLVLDTGGKPAPGVEVIAYRFGYTGNVMRPLIKELPTLTAVTSDSGIVRLPCSAELDVERWLVVARSPGAVGLLLLPLREGVLLDVQNHKPAEVFNLRMRPASGRVAGTVLDPEGAPVAGASASIRGLLAIPSDSREFEKAGLPPLAGVEKPYSLSLHNLPCAKTLLRAQTDEKGRFEIAGLPEGFNGAVVYFESKGFGRDPEVYGINGDEKAVMLARACRIEGRVVAAEPGMPVSDLTVTLNSQYVAEKTRTDAEGGFRFDDLAPGRYQLQVPAPEDLSWTVKSAGIELAAGDTREVQLTVEKTWTVTGRVVGSASGEGVPGILVSCWENQQEFNDVTDEKGAYTLMLPAGKHALTVMRREGEGGWTGVSYQPRRITIDVNGMGPVAVQDLTIE